MQHTWKAIGRVALFGMMGLLLLMGINTSPAQAAGTVGDGTPGSCTRAAIAEAAADGGLVTFNCGANPVSITIDQTLEFQDHDVTIDGGGLVTLQGVPGVRMVYFRTWGFDASQTLTFRNITFNGASLSGVGTNSNGAAIQVENRSANWNTDIPVLAVENVTFTNNTSTLTALPPDHQFAYDYGGAAIYILGGSLKVKNSTFTGNTVNGGTGATIHGLGSNIKIKGSTFSNNTATGSGFPNDPWTGYGGVLYVDGTLARGNGKIKIKTSTFTNNQAVNQGGVAYINLYPSRDSRLIIDKSTFDNNTVDGGQLGWGGVISGGGTGGAANFRISRSSFTGNTAAGADAGGNGGALAFPQPTNVTISNSTFANNLAEVNCDTCPSGRGGAMYFGDGSFKIYNSTIANNIAEWQAGAIMGGNGTIHNTLFADNQALSQAYGDASTTRHCNTTHSGSNNLMFPNGTDCTPNIRVKDPLLGTLTDGMIPLTLASPAANKGSATICANAPVKNRDQRSVRRPQGKRCDIGAYELQGVAPGASNLTSPANGASTTPTEFTWTAADEAGTYVFKVKKGNGKTVAKAKLTAAEANCASDATCTHTLTDANIKAGKTYTWSVKVKNPFGKFKSETFSFTADADTPTTGGLRLPPAVEGNGTRGG